MVKTKNVNFEDMKSKLPFIAAGTIILLLSSCAALFRGAVMPNQCQRCAVYNTMTMDTIEVFEGCGSENVRLEESAKVSAYEYMKWNNDCNVEVYCTTWRKDPEE